MTTLLTRLTVASLLLLLLSGRAASAQTADEVIEKTIAALGGRAAHAKLSSRSTTGTIVLSTPAGEIKGTIETLTASPNKSRSVIKADLTALGAGELVIDQRFNGTAGYVLDSLQGNRDMPPGQVANMRNSSFPHPFLTYKEQGSTATLSGKEKVGARDALVVLVTPKAGSPVRTFIDAETFLPLKNVVKVEVPQLGGELEQTTEFSDFRAVDGVKVPFEIKSSSSVQSFTVTTTAVQHNVKVDEGLFSKP
jgi:hypothetical protein